MYISHLGHLEMEQARLRDLLTMVMNHLRPSWDDPPSRDLRFAKPPTKTVQLLVSTWAARLEPAKNKSYYQYT